MVDSKNILRVDLYDCYRYAEQISVYRSHTINEGLDSDQIAICESDYGLLHKFATEACSEIADRANYIKNVTENGLDALTYYPDPDQKAKEAEFTSLPQVPEHHKLLGESMESEFKTLMIFNIPELEGQEIYRYTVVQTYIQEAITHYILMKWYHTNGLFEFKRQEEELFEKAVSKIRFNSITNTKRMSVKRKYRPFG